jgi:hypothetical protein
MYIPPWLLAFIVLIMAAAMGVSIMRSFHGLPENFSEQIDDMEEEEEPYMEPFEEQEEDSAPAAPPAPEPIPVASSTHVSADAVIGPEFDSYLQQVKATVGNSVVPSQDKLDMISGGPAPSANDSLVQQYLPNQERILPHDLPPQRAQAITANVPDDAGTEAEAIQASSIGLRTVRENVRGDTKKNQGFTSPSAITYVHT